MDETTNGLRQNNYNMDTPLLKALKAFEESAIMLSNVWENSSMNDSDIMNTSYPFIEDFSTLAIRASKWADKVREEFEHEQTIIKQ